MASLYKKSTTVTDPKSGKVKRVSLATDKAASQAMLNRLVTRSENLAAGRLDPSDEHQRRPLDQHLGDFTKNLSDRGNTTDHIKSTTQRVHDVLVGCRFTFINQISASRVQGFMADLRAGGRALATHDEKLSKRPASIANANHYLRAMKMFTRWLVKDRRTDDDRLAHLSYQNVETDRRRVRRPLTIDELSRLIETTAVGPERLCLSGPDRAALYTLAAFTGFRRNELGSITVDSFDFASEPPTVTIEAAYAKNRRRDMIPLQTDAAERLQSWLASKGKLDPRRPLFNVTDAHTATMLQADLRAAGIDPVDGSGRVVDFHALRGTFISNLAKAGVSLTMAQKLARHSDPKLTANVYTVLGVLDHAAAVESLPMIVTGPAPHTEAATMRATGTDGRIDESISDVSVVPSVVPCGAQNGALRLASIPTDLASNCIETGVGITTPVNDLTPGLAEGYSVDLHQVASLCSEVPEVGLEPTHSCEYWILSPVK